MTLYGNLELNTQLAEQYNIHYLGSKLNIDDYSHEIKKTTDTNLLLMYLTLVADCGFKLSYSDNQKTLMQDYLYHVLKNPRLVKTASIGLHLLLACYEGRQVENYTEYLGILSKYPYMSDRLTKAIITGEDITLYFSMGLSAYELVDTLDSIIDYDITKLESSVYMMLLDINTGIVMKHLTEIISDQGLNGD